MNHHIHPGQTLRRGLAFQRIPMESRERLPAPDIHRMPRTPEAFHHTPPNESIPARNNTLHRDSIVIRNSIFE
jgi:hypothetical protein